MMYLRGHTTLPCWRTAFRACSPIPVLPSIEDDVLFRVESAQGVCEVVLYSPHHSLTLAQSPVEQIYKLILVWMSRYRELSKLPFVKCVFIFENKGEAVGVTLHHPHGQIYAYPFIPPRIQKEVGRIAVLFPACRFLACSAAL
jgi:UDPglucose--hexose-1-phosphate uridylyltransferase